MQSENINKELTKISNWLKANKLSLNANKTKFMILHMPQKKIEYPVLQIDGAHIECVNDFNFLGITINNHLNWQSHTNKIANKISKTIGILNKLKHFLPPNTLYSMYNALILPHINYGLLLWGHQAHRIFKLQNKAIRIISLSKYNAHTSPIFKRLQLLKLDDI